MGHVKSASQLVSEMQRIWERADNSGRDLTMSERTDVENLLLEIKQMKGIEDLGRELGVGVGPAMAGGGQPSGASPGAAFVRSSGYKQIRDSASRGQSWSSGAVDVGTLGMHTKGNLFEGAGGTLVPPDYVPGVVSALFQPVGFADFLPQRQTPSTQVRYVVEGTAVSGASGVAEGAAKPESTLAYSEVIEQVRKIATTLPCSDELLSDAVAIEAYVNTRLVSFLKLEEERQLLRGVGSGSNELLGIFGRAISTTNAGTSNADRIFRAAAGVRGSAFLDPDVLVVHPTNWITARLQQDAAGQYYGGGPWGTNYGAGGGAQVTSFSSSPYWGMRVWVSTHVGAGTALVGASQSAAIFRRGGATVESTNSHSDFFVKDLSMLRAEQREALAVYRPGAWCAVTGLT